MVSADKVKDFARRIGLDLIGITSAEPLLTLAFTSLSYDSSRGTLLWPWGTLEILLPFQL